MAASTVGNYVDALAQVSLIDIIELVECEPNGARTIWDRLRAKSPKSRYVHTFIALKALLRFAAERKIGAWSPVYLTLISSSLPLPPKDKYAAVRSDDVFITIEDESVLVQWIESQPFDLSGSPRDFPTPPFAEYIKQGKALAQQTSLSWNIALSEIGVALAGQSWNLRKLLNDGNPTSAKLRTFST